MKKTLPEGKPLNCMLQSMGEVNEATDEIQRYGLIPHGLSCKNWDIMRILPRISDGNFCDLGADGSFILQNLVHCGHEGLKYGIDLAFPADREDGEIKYFKGDLMNTPFEDGIFKTLTCLSVVEHQVDYTALAKECGRLLAPGGQLFLTCDYWNPKIATEGMKLYSLDWNILCRLDVIKLIEKMYEAGLQITSDVDWRTAEAVINPAYCSPVQGVSYTFGIFHFIKK